MEIRLNGEGYKFSIKNNSKGIPKLTIELFIENENDHEEESGKIKLYLNKNELNQLKDEVNSFEPA